MQDENGNLIFIDLDDGSFGDNVDIDFSNDVLDHFMNFVGFTEEYYIRLENNLDISPCSWYF